MRTPASCRTTSVIFLLSCMRRSFSVRKWPKPLLRRSSKPRSAGEMYRGAESLVTAAGRVGTVATSVAVIGEVSAGEIAIIWVSGS